MQVSHILNALKAGGVIVTVKHNDGLFNWYLFYTAPQATSARLEWVNKLTVNDLNDAVMLSHNDKANIWELSQLGTIAWEKCADDLGYFYRVTSFAPAFEPEPPINNDPPEPEDLDPELQPLGLKQPDVIFAGVIAVDSIEPKYVNGRENRFMVFELDSDGNAIGDMPEDMTELDAYKLAAAKLAEYLELQNAVESVKPVTTGFEVNDRVFHTKENLFGIVTDVILYVQFFGFELPTAIAGGFNLVKIDSGRKTSESVG